jgi:glutamate-1-semialdehyde 2,1-aminomutase
VDGGGQRPARLRRARGGPGFTDVDGFSYVDFNASDMAMFCGHANPAVVRAIKAQAERSTQFLLPTEASVEVAEELARRYPVPMWQFTLSATQANAEAIRLARAVTGRDVVLLFQGHYHGHFEEGVVDLDGDRVAALERGLSKASPAGSGSRSSTTWTGSAPRSGQGTWRWCSPSPP